jgi:hypothetical protein
MAWVSINGTEYYYRSHWVDGTVKTQYYGKGLVANSVASAHERLADALSKQVEVDREYIADVTNQLASVTNSCDWNNSLVRATAISQGFVRHERGSEWRRTQV